MKNRQTNVLWIASICMVLAAGCDKSDEVKAAAEAEKASLEAEKAQIEQEKKTAEALQQLDAETARQKELYLKLQGAIEGIELLHPEVKKEEEAPAAAAPEASPEAVTEAVS